MADQEWYVTSNGVQSADRHQHVAALVALSPSARSTTVGRTIVLRGHVTPSHAGEVVLIEMSRGRRWQVIARPRLGHGSGYSVSHRFARGRRGQAQSRAPSPTSATSRSTSPTVTLTVKG